VLTLSNSAASSAVSTSVMSVIFPYRSAHGVKWTLLPAYESQAHTSIPTMRLPQAAHPVPNGVTWITGWFSWTHEWP
jgi:hypothetical protein